MSTPPRQGPPAAPGPGEPPPDAPATVEDVRGLRRWLWVVGIWAAAASIIALIALIDSGNGSDKESASTQSDVARLEERLTGRLDNIEQTLDEKASTEDVQKLESRVAKAERDAADAADASSQAADDLRRLSQRVDDLEQRVEELEAGPPSP